MILWIMLFAWMITRAIHQGRAEHALAEKGIVPPRMTARYGTEQAAQRVPRYGLSHHLVDAWRDGWARRTDAVIAARDAKAKGEDPKAAAAEVLTRDDQPVKTPKPERDSTIPDPIPDEPDAEQPTSEPIGEETPTGETGEQSAPKPEPDTAETPEPQPTPAPETTATVQSAPPAPAGNVVDLNSRRPQQPAAQAANSPVVPASDRDIRPAPFTQDEVNRLRNGLYGKCGQRTEQGEWCDNPNRPDSPYCWEHQTENDQEEQPMTSPTPTLPTVPSGEAVTVPQLVEQAKGVQLHTAALRERTTAAVADLAKTTENIEASAALMEMPTPVMGAVARAREAVASLTATLNGVTEEVNSAMREVETEAAKHLAVVEQSAALGGLARNTAYQSA